MKTQLKTTIHWKEVIIWSLLGIFLFFAALAIWYWAYVWLPQKESRALKAHFDNIERQYRLLHPQTQTDAKEL